MCHSALVHLKLLPRMRGSLSWSGMKHRNFQTFNSKRDESLKSELWMNHKRCAMSFMEKNYFVQFGKFAISLMWPAVMMVLWLGSICCPNMVSQEECPTQEWLAANKMTLACTGVPSAARLHEHSIFLVCPKIVRNLPTFNFFPLTETNWIKKLKGYSVIWL